MCLTMMDLTDMLDCDDSIEVLSINNNNHEILWEKLQYYKVRVTKYDVLHRITFRR